MNKIEKELQESNNSVTARYDIVVKYSVGFCNWIINITDDNIKKIKDPEELFKIYVDQL